MKKAGVFDAVFLAAIGLAVVFGLGGLLIEARLPAARPFALFPADIKTLIPDLKERIDISSTSSTEDQPAAVSLPSAAPLEKNTDDSKREENASSDYESDRERVGQVAHRILPTLSELKPPIALHFSQDKDELTGEVLIKAAVEGARKVVFFLRRPQSLQKVYLGQAALVKRSDQRTAWRFLWDTSNTPNGRYLLQSQVTNIYGAYEPEPTAVIIANQLPPPSTEEIVEKIKERLPKEQASAENLKKIRQQVEKMTRPEEISVPDREELAQKKQEIATAAKEIVDRLANEVEVEIEQSHQELQRTAKKEEAKKVISAKESAVKEESPQPTGESEEELASPEQKPEQERQEAIRQAAQERLERLTARAKKRVETAEKREQTEFRKPTKNLIDSNIVNRAGEEFKKELDNTRGEILAELEPEPEAGEGAAAREQRLSAIKEELQLQVRQRRDIIVEKVTERIVQEEILGEKAAELVMDIDGDGLSQLDEQRFGTDPLNPDTDGDGFIDGFEVRTGFNPTRISPDDKMVQGDPITEGKTRPDVYRVENVRLEVADKETGPEEKLIFEGTALPLTYVTLYIYSLPTVVTVRTDAFGRWSYTLDRALDDGQHQVYVVVANNKGQVEEKSQPLRFVKVAQAVSIVDAETTFLAPGLASQRPLIDPLRTFFIGVVLIVIAAAVVAVLIISFQDRRRKKMPR